MIKNPRENVAKFERKPARSASPKRETRSKNETSLGESMRATVVAYMLKKGLRWTDQRRVILDVFLATKGHVTLEEIYALSKKEDARIGHATVYRTVRLFVECGVAEERRFDHVTRFEVKSGKGHHDHLICTTCGAIVEFEEPRIEAMQSKVAAKFDFEMQSHKLEMYGTCAACRGRR